MFFFKIHVVNEKRLYPVWSKDQTNASMISIASGITNGKRLLNNLHYELAIGGFREASHRLFFFLIYTLYEYLTWVIVFRLMWLEYPSELRGMHTNFLYTYTIQCTSFGWPTY